MQFSSRFKIVAATVAMLGVGSAAQAVTIYGIDDQQTNTLFSVDSAAPDTILTGVPVTGLAANETLRAIDFRTNGVLYGVGSQNHLYSINTATGAATAVGGTFSPTLNGVNFDSDFNPVVDLLRIVSDADQNLRVSPTTGAVVNVDTPLTYTGALTGTNPNIAGIAYSNNFAGAASTSLYAIDSGNDSLSVIANPNSGQLALQGPLGLNVTAVLGFDIVTVGGVNTGYAALQTSGSSLSQLYRIDLVTGAATLVDAFGGDFVVRDITVAVPEPASLALIGLAGVGLVARRRRA